MATFPNLLEELPSIAIAHAEEAHAANIAEEEEAEAQDVVEGSHTLLLDKGTLCWKTMTSATST